ncbi:MAG: hypothetical protein ACLTDF_09680 [Coprococcus sp.]
MAEVCEPEAAGAVVEVLNRTCDYFIWDIDVMEEDVTPREEIVIRMNRSGSFCSFGGDMLKIAVYSEEKVMSPLLQEYMGIWQRCGMCVRCEIL